MANSAIFWDFDGTLSHPNKRFETALYLAITENGYEADPSVCEAFLETAYPWKQPFSLIVTEENWWRLLLQRIRSFCKSIGLPAQAASPICERFRELLIDVGNYRLYEDTISTLAHFQNAGYRNYLLTNNYPEITNNLEALGIKSYFSNFVISSLLGWEKPSPMLYAIAKDIAGNPECCYMVGDNPIADIEGGNRAGMKTIYIHNGFLSTAWNCADTLTDTIPLIK